MAWRCWSSGNDGAESNVVSNNVIAGNGRHGVWVKGAGVSNSNSSYLNRVRANRIGLTLSGTLGNGADGVLLSEGAFDNLMGGPNEADRNIISGNGQDGVRIAESDYNGVVGNYVGANAAGTAACKPMPAAAS